MKREEITYVILTPEDDKHVLTDGTVKTCYVSVLKEGGEEEISRWQEIELEEDAQDTENEDINE